MSVNFFLHESYCAPEAKSDYEAIAKATGGFSLSFRSKLAMYDLEQEVKGSLDGTSFIASGNTNTDKSVLVTRKIELRKKIL